MNPADPVQPHAGEAPLSLDFGLVVLAIGALIFIYLIWKLAGEYRQRQARGDRTAESADPAESDR